MQRLCPALSRGSLAKKLRGFSAHADGSLNAFICVSSFNEKAQRLYQGLAYEVVGELKDYIVAGHSEILLRQSIGPLTEFSRSKAHHTTETD